MERLLNDVVEEVVWNSRHLHEGPLILLPPLQFLPVILLSVFPPRSKILDHHVVHLSSASQPSPHNILLQPVGINPYLHGSGKEVSAVDLLSRSKIFMWIILVFLIVGS